MALFWRTFGSGKNHLILLHGWGLNSVIWLGIINQLTIYFQVHLVDLPGYGYSTGYKELNLLQIANEIIVQAQDNSLILGWSLGGLIAIIIAYQWPTKIRGLITVASSPYFCKDINWPGIKPELFLNLKKMLKKDFLMIINHFFTFQIFINQCNKYDIVWIKDLIIKQPKPSFETLISGLIILQNSDLRYELNQLNLPILRIYGSLDGLVPKKVIPFIDSLCSNSKSIILSGAAHAPFLSHPDIFCKELILFHQNI